MLRVGLSADSIRRLSSSAFNYWAGYVANIGLVFWLISQAFVGPASMLTLWEWSLSLLIGILVWTLGEYTLHRYLYHEVPSALVVGHNMHHDEPKALLGVPWYLTTLALVGAYYLLAMVFDSAWTGSVMAFFWLGYIAYCAVHHSLHHHNFKNSMWKSLRRHHLVHHARDNVNWGITTDFWDRVFRTKV